MARKRRQVRQVGGSTRIVARSRSTQKESAERVSLVDNAYREIRKRILDNKYPPSHQVLEHELAAELGMSRTPVREALVRLQNDNFVRLVPRHGMRVVPLSLEDLRDMYEVLTALELAAIQRIGRKQPSGKDLKELDDAIDDMDRAMKQKDRDGWAHADERFHKTLIELCGNPRLIAMAYTLWDQGHRARMTTLRLRPSLETSNREHRLVVEAIRKGDWRKACAEHAEHRERTSQEIVRLLEEFRLGNG